MHVGKSYACVLLFVASACAARPVRPAPASAPEAAPLTQPELQGLSERHCATCHQSSVSREKPAALAVFDLDDVNWSARLGAAQLAVFYQRMKGELDAPTRRRLLAYTERAAQISAARPPESSGAGLAR